LDKQNFEIAEQVFQTILQYQPRNTRAHLELGIIYINRKDYQKAYEMISRANQLSPNNKEILNLLKAFIIK